MSLREPTSLVSSDRTAGALPLPVEQRKYWCGGRRVDVKRLGATRGALDPPCPEQQRNSWCGVSETRLFEAVSEVALEGRTAEPVG